MKKRDREGGDNDSSKAAVDSSKNATFRRRPGE